MLFTGTFLVYLCNLGPGPVVVVGANLRLRTPTRQIKISETKYVGLTLDACSGFLSSFHVPTYLKFLPKGQK